MSKLVRFGISLEENLLKKFDSHLKEGGYTNRSEAIRDLIREGLVEREWQDDEEITGAVTLVYDHHKRELVNRLVGIQHSYHDNTISTQHLHLDRDNCLEIIAVKGRADRIKALYGRLKAEKGVKHALLAMSTTGKKIG
ncbi:MAG: nickel-responsive transcriptional regulator NikR [Candidatus Omnitrophota bacterium]